MSLMAERAAKMLDMLPAADQSLAIELIKKLVLAWDPDFTKLTPSEINVMNIAETEIIAGETVNHNDICW